VLLVDGVCMLVEVVTTDPTLWTVFFRGATVIIMAQAKDGFYHDQFSINMFFFLLVKVLKYLHQ